MKTLLLTLFTFFSATCIAQGLEVEKESGVLKMERIIEAPGMTKDVLYTKLKTWFGESFKNSSQVITADNREDGYLSGRYIREYPLWTVYHNFYNVLRVYIKDNKVKAVLTNFELASGGTKIEGYLLKKDGTFRERSYQNLKEEVENEGHVIFQSIEKALTKKEAEW